MLLNKPFTFNQYISMNNNADRSLSQSMCSSLPQPLDALQPHPSATLYIRVSVPVLCNMNVNLSHPHRTANTFCNFELSCNNYFRIIQLCLHVYSPKCGNQTFVTFGDFAVGMATPLMWKEPDAHTGSSVKQRQILTAEKTNDMKLSLL